MNRKQRNRERVAELIEKAQHSRSTKLPARVRCQHSLHKITLINGKLALLDHPKELREHDYAMCALAGSKPYRCYMALMSFKVAMGNTDFVRVNEGGVPYRVRHADCPGKLINVANALRSITKERYATAHKSFDHYGLEYKSVSLREALRLSKCDREIRKVLREAHLSMSKAKTIRIFSSVFVRSSGCMTRGPGRLGVLDVYLKTDHWLTEVFRHGLQVLDGYLVLQIIKLQDGELEAYVLYKDNVARAKFNKPMGRKHWWKPWQKPDEGKVWRIKCLQ